LATFDDGSGPALFVGGYYLSTYLNSVGTGSGIPIMKWNGSAFQSLAPSPVAHEGWVVVLDEGSGPSLYGEWTSPSGYQFGRWNGTGWEPTTPGFFGANTAPFVSVYEASGPVIYGLSISPTNGNQLVVKWNGTEWVSLGEVENSASVYGMLGYRDGPAESLYIYGLFSSGINGTPAWGIARWNGATWEAPGWNDHRFNAYAACIADLGTGPELYIGGDIILPPWTDATTGISRWNGQRWEDVVGGLSGAAQSPMSINAMAEFNDGTGPALYVAGGFSSVGGVHVRNIAKWDGRSWSGLGGGIGAYVTQFAVFNDPRGSSLFAGGDFQSVGAVGIGAGGGYSAGLAQYVGCIGQNYADCDGNGTRNVNDFMCFINKYATRDPYADCDMNGYINAADFMCFLNKFVQ
jgi:hypothetical protein